MITSFTNVMIQWSTSFTNVMSHLLPTQCLVFYKCNSIFKVIFTFTRDLHWSEPLSLGKYPDKPLAHVHFSAEGEVIFRPSSTSLKPLASKTMPGSYGMWRWDDVSPVTVSLSTRGASSATRTWDSVPATTTSSSLTRELAVVVRPGSTARYRELANDWTRRMQLGHS